MGVGWRSWDALFEDRAHTGGEANEPGKGARMLAVYYS